MVKQNLTGLKLKESIIGKFLKFIKEQISLLISEKVALIVILFESYPVHSISFTKNHKSAASGSFIGFRVILREELDSTLTAARFSRSIKQNLTHSLLADNCTSYISNVAWSNKRFSAVTVYKMSSTGVVAVTP